MLKAKSLSFLRLEECSNLKQFLFQEEARIQVLAVLFYQGIHLHCPAPPSMPAPALTPSAHCHVTGSSLPLLLPRSPTRGAQIKWLFNEAFCPASCVASAHVSTPVFCLPGFSTRSSGGIESSAAAENTPDRPNGNTRLLLNPPQGNPLEGTEFTTM